MPRAVVITTLALSALAALGGYWLGQNRGEIADKVNAIAAEHARRTGGNPDECVGWIMPGNGALQVTCGDIRYRIGRFGVVHVVMGAET